MKEAKDLYTHLYIVQFGIRCGVQRKDTKVNADCTCYVLNE